MIGNGNFVLPKMSSPSSIIECITSKYTDTKCSDYFYLNILFFLVRCSTIPHVWTINFSTLNYLWALQEVPKDSLMSKRGFIRCVIDVFPSQFIIIIPSLVSESFDLEVRIQVSSLFILHCAKFIILNMHSKYEILMNF